MNHKFAFLILLVALLFTPLALSVSEAKATGWYSAVDSFSFNGADYTLRLMGGEYRSDDEEHNLYGGTLRIGKDDEKVIVSLGSCHETINHSYCFLNKSFEREKVTIDSQGELQPAIQVQLIEYDYSSKVEISRSFEKTKFALYEIGEVEVTVTNTGDHPLENVRFSETAPEGFIIDWHQSNVAQQDKTLQAVYNLYPGNSWSTKYKIKGVNYTKSNYATTILYDAEDAENVEKKSSSATIEVLQPYSLDVSCPANVKRGQATEFKLTITNNENEALEVASLSVVIPLSLGVSGKTSLTTYAFNNLGYTGSIPAKETKEFIARLSTPYVGSYSITYEGELAVKEKQYNFSGTKDIAVTTTGLNCYFTFNKPNLQAGRKLQYTAVLKNLGDLDDYYAINGTIHTPHEDIPFFVPSLFREDTEIIVNKKYHLPFATQDKEYPFSISATYRTQTGQTFRCEEENNYLAKGAENVLDFDIFVSAEKPSPGDRVNLIISIGNELAEDIYDITITTNTTDGEIVEGIRRKQLGYLGAQKKEEMNTISVLIPKDYTKETLKVFTTGVVESHNYTDTEITTIPIKLPTIEDASNDEDDDANTQQENDDTLQDDSANNQEENESNEEKGFFKRVWNFIKSLW